MNLTSCHLFDEARVARMVIFSCSLAAVAVAASSVAVMQHENDILSDSGGGFFASNDPYHQSSHRAPYFADQGEGENIQRVAVGRSVKFRCIVNNLGKHKVAWFHKDKRILLALDNVTVAWKDRAHASTPASGVFELQIERVKLEDKGNYTCQIPSSKPVQSQLHLLDVLQSPQIKEDETSVNVEAVKEFSPAELRCVAEGIPKPVIKWRRESQMHVLPATGASFGNQAMPDEPEQPEETPGEQRAKGADDSAKQNASTYAFSLSAGRLQPGSSFPSFPSKTFIAEGETLRFNQTSRYDMGFYMCIASNGVPPSVSQRIFLPVSFAPLPPTPTKASASSTSRATPISHARSSKTSLKSPANLNGGRSASVSTSSKQQHATTHFAGSSSGCNHGRSAPIITLLHSHLLFALVLLVVVLLSHTF